MIRREGDEPRVAIVHRPRHDDWSLPKGKLDEGEGFLEAALREVEEETGAICRPGPELPSSTYRDQKGRKKLVRWWLMHPLEVRDRLPDAEVDQVRWLEPGEARRMLTYEADRELLAEALERERRDRPD